jgi:hypothetical protein
MKSIMQPESDRGCYLCEIINNDYSPKLTRQEHHIFGGPNRKWSEKFGLKVKLCLRHHEGDISGQKSAVHRPDLNNYADILHIRAQREFEKNHTRKEFTDIFGRNYIW